MDAAINNGIVFRPSLTLPFLMTLIIASKDVTILLYWKNNVDT